MISCRGRRLLPAVIIDPFDGYGVALAGLPDVDKHPSSPLGDGPRESLHAPRAQRSRGASDLDLQKLSKATHHAIADSFHSRPLMPRTPPLSNAVRSMDFALQSQISRFAAE